MIRYTLPTLLTLAFCGVSQAMIGGPVFLVPQSMTSMTVEVGQTNLDVNASTSAAGNESTFESKRLGLSARYGVSNSLDIGAMLGTANLGMNDIGGGYSDFSSSWAMSWGANVRAGFPVGAPEYQIVGSLNYMGFQPDGKTSNGMKTIGSKYTWHEVTPAITAGMRVGSVIPYCGIAKPFLIGQKDVSVRFNGQEYPSAGGSQNYTDSEQAFRGLFGLEWHLPEGYSVMAEGSASMEGQWSISLGLTQVLR